MSWLSSASSNAKLVDNLVANRLITTARIEAAMRKVDRGHYISRNAYEDSPQPIGFGVTISAPHMHAMCLEALKDHLMPGMKGLDIGSGSGYLTACMGILIGETGKAVGIDHIPELVQQSIENVRSDNPQLLENGSVILKVSDGFKGYESEAPYDAIHVGAAAEKVPQALIDQLKIGGRLIIPVGPRYGDQNLMQYDKLKNNALKETTLTGVRYVPLTTKEKQLGGH